MTINCSNDNIKTKEKVKGELQMMSRMIKAESLARVHTHTHTHTISLNNKKYINKSNGNISLSGNYNDTG